MRRSSDVGCPGHEAVAFQGVDEPGDGRTRHSGPVGEFRRGQSPTAITAGLFCAAPEGHQHAEASLRDVVPGKVAVYYPEDLISGAKQVKEDLRR